MTNNFFTLRHIAETLDSSLKGAAIAGAFTQDRDIVVIVLEGRGEHFVVSCRGDFPTCYLDHRIARARQNTTDVLPLLVGNSFRSIAICPGDRVVTAMFASGLRLALQFFGTKNNALVVGTDGTIVDAFHSAKTLMSTRYVEPVSHDLPSSSEIVARIHSFPDLEIPMALKKALPLLGATLAGEMVFRAGIERSRTVHDLADAHRQALERAVQSVFDDLQSPSPSIYFASDGTPRLLSIIPLRHLEPSERRIFPSIHEAMQAYFALRQSTSHRDQQEAQIRGALESARNRASRTLAAMQKDEEEHDRASMYQEFGSLLMTHLADIPGGATVFTSPLSDGAGSIPLDPHLSPVQNAQRYFEKAKHARLSRQQAAERKRVLKNRITVADSLLLALKAATTREEFDAFMKRHPEELEDFGIGKKGPTPHDLPFRMFVVDGGFDVWAGKDNASNDLLTLRHAKPNDLWFHARGCPGSHVILRTATGQGVPGKRSKQQAASVAAYYSKMRNARMVPVTMTERKYVHKPKGAAPGSVVVTHEDTLFAEPQLPEPSAKHTHSDQI